MGSFAESDNKCFIVAVAGGTCAGKKLLCDRIKTELSTHVSSPNSVFILNAENFYNQPNGTDIEVCASGEYNFDIPRAYNFRALADCLRAFKDDSVREVTIPTYDLETHVSTPVGKVIPKPRIVLVEGIFVLYDQAVRALVDMKIFVDVASDVRLAVRVMKENPAGNPEKLEKLLLHYMKYVKPGYDEFIVPTKKYADIIIPRGVDNHIGVDLIIQHILGILEGQHDGIPTFPIDRSTLLFIE